jgi:hypothetical protein
MTEPSPVDELRTAAATLLAGKPEHPATLADEYPDLDAALAGVLSMQATALEYNPDWNGVETRAALETARRINAGEAL